MSLLVLLAVIFVGTGAALLARPWPRIASAVGLVGLTAALIASLALDPTVRLDVGGTALVSSPYLRLFLILGAFTGLAAFFGAFA